MAFLGPSLICLIAIAMVYGGYVVTANESATIHLDRNSKLATKLLYEQGLEFCHISWRDCALFQVRYSTLKGAEAGIPSRIFLRLLRKRNYILLNTLCQKAEDALRARNSAKYRL